MHIFLKNRAFRQMTINEWVSGFGDTIFYLAFINYVSSYDFAPLAIFLISLSETVPNVLQLFTGVVADFQKNRISKYVFVLLTKVILYSTVALLLVSTDFSLVSVLFICCMNLISDSLGFFAGSMLTPIYLRLISDDMTEAMGFRQSTSAIVRLIGNLSGGLFLGVFSVGTLAWINVVTFLFAYLGILFIRQELKEIESEIEVPTYIGMTSFFQHLKKSIKLLIDMGDVMILLWILSIAQAILMMVDPVSTLLLIQHPFMGLETGQSLAVLMMTSMGFIIFGGLVSGFVSKRISIQLNIYFSLLMEGVIVLGFLSGEFLLIIFGMAGTALAFGALSPRLQAVIFSIIPEETVGAVQSAINLICMLIPAAISLALVGLATSGGLIVTAIVLALLLLVAAYLAVKMKRLPTS